ncbi:MAG: DegV family protein [Anaerolineae bacterium]
MANIHIVTDSFAHFINPHFVHQHPVTVVPNKINIGGKLYREDVDISAEEAVRLIAQQSFAPQVTSPSVADYAAVYSKLARHHDAIISIHASSQLYPSFQNAKAAAAQTPGPCEIVVIDSQTVCAGQGMLVRYTAKSLEKSNSIDELIRMIRGTIERLYSIYYVESIDYLLQNKILSASHSILGAMLSIKPFLTIENGILMPIEKVRTRTQAVERLVEFLVEFETIEDVVILQHKTHMSEQTRMLQDRLALEFPGRYFPYAIYGASLAALIGTDATGLVVLEGEMEQIDDDL